MHFSEDKQVFDRYMKNVQHHYLTGSGNQNHNEILFNIYKEGYPSKYENRDESTGNYAK